MEWASPEAPIACMRCREEYRPGAWMARYTFGPVTLWRCEACESEVATKAADIRRAQVLSVKTSFEEAAIVGRVTFGEPLSAIAARSAHAKRRN